jgi:hypothetical protein
MSDIYRVYNDKEDYQQSYDSRLKDSLEWAIDCAKRTNGKVFCCELKDGNTSNKKQVYPVK